MEIKSYDSPKVIELKNRINKAREQQDKLCDKFKCVQEYRKLQQDIGLMHMQIEQLEEDEDIDLWETK